MLRSLSEAQVFCPARTSPSECALGGFYPGIRGAPNLVLIIECGPRLPLHESSFSGPQSCKTCICYLSSAELIFYDIFNSHCHVGKPMQKPTIPPATLSRPSMTGFVSASACSGRALSKTGPWSSRPSTPVRFLDSYPVPCMCTDTQNPSYACLQAQPEPPLADSARARLFQPMVLPLFGRQDKLESAAGSFTYELNLCNRAAKY